MDRGRAQSQSASLVLFTGISTEEPLTRESLQVFSVQGSFLSPGGIHDTKQKHFHVDGILKLYL